MNEMRKLIEAVNQINEGWDVSGIAGAIYDEIRDIGSQVHTVFTDDEEPEPYRAAIYEYGYLTRLYNPKTLDGSEIWHEIVDELERRVVGINEYNNPIEEAEKLGSDSAAGKWAADTLEKNGLPVAVDVPIDFVMRQLQQKVTETAYKAQQLSSYIKRAYPEEKEKYNVTVDVEMELDRLRKMIFDAR